MSPNRIVRSGSGYNLHTVDVRRSMPPQYLIRANWDAEARVWVASSDDVPGLAVESETLRAGHRSRGGRATEPLRRQWPGARIRRSPLRLPSGIGAARSGSTHRLATSRAAMRRSRPESVGRTVGSHRCEHGAEVQIVGEHRMVVLSSPPWSHRRPPEDRRHRTSGRRANPAVSTSAPTWGRGSHRSEV